MSRHKVILDCDPGIDDSLAVWLALAADAIDLLAITTVAGNVPLTHTARNARRVCTLAGREVPVYAGCSRPLMRPSGVTAEEIHGDDGLGGVALPEPAFDLQPGHAVDYLVDTVMTLEPGEITLCAVGPLTNVALAVIKQPAVATRLREIVIMGGAAAEPGNVTPVAEFNIYVDPHAAQVVLDAGANVTLAPLDLTHQAIATAARRDRLRAQPGRVAETAAAMLDHYDVGDPALHDPCTIAYLLAPALFAGVDAHVQVECAAPLTLGQTVTAIEPRHRRGAANVRLLDRVDADGFFALLTDHLAELA